MPEPQIVLSEFEKLTGISNQTISHAIKKGKIPTNLVMKTGERRPVYIYPRASAEEWLKNLVGSTPATHEVRTKLEKFLKITNGELKEKIKETKKPDKQSLILNNQTTYAEAQRIEKIRKAELAELEVKEKKGLLVSKSLVYKQLYEFGKELRTEFQSMPNRIAPDLAAAIGNVNKITIILAAEINRSLNKLHDIETKEIG